MSTVSQFPRPEIVHVRLIGRVLSISPDPVKVRQGTPVQWKFDSVTSRANPRDLRWTVYFDQGSPLDGNVTTIEVDGLEGEIVETVETIARTPGDWKYGVRVHERHLPRIALADDDPILRVLS